MTEQECRAFVLSGYIPTSNDDIADIQDCFNHQSVDFQIGLLLDIETRTKAESLMRSCLHSKTHVDNMIQLSNQIAKQLTMRKQYADHITHLEKQIEDMRVFITETENMDERYGKYLQ